MVAAAACRDVAEKLKQAASDAIFKNRTANKDLDEARVFAADRSWFNPQFSCIASRVWGFPVIVSTYYRVES
jgi:hypothetical protein